jgi:RNA polymerase sigma-70 factor (ECF subfamily)
MVCLRYANSREEAEENMQEGFINAFTNIKKFRKEGSFEGWLRKIMVNASLQRLRSKAKLYPVVDLIDDEVQMASKEEILSHIGTKDLLKLIQNLSPAYRIVFNLYVFEGMKHREIAEMLKISEGTSKSNLSDARTILQRQIKALYEIKNEKINIL